MKRRMSLLTGALLTWVAALSSCGDGSGGVIDSDAGFGGSGGRGVSTGTGGASGSSVASGGASGSSVASGSGGASGSSVASGSGGVSGSGGGGRPGGSGGSAGSGGNGGKAGGGNRDSGIDVTIIGTDDGGGTGGRSDASASRDAGTCPTSANAAACVACCDARYPGAFADAFFGNECLYCTAECGNTRICTTSTAINGPCLGCAQPYMTASDCRFGSALCPSLIECLKQCPTN